MTNERPGTATTWVVASASLLYLIAGCIGTAVAVDAGLPAAFLGIRTGLSPLQDWFAMGTALSPPFIFMLVQLGLTLALATRGAWRGRALRWLTVLAAMEFLGMLGEPITYDVLPPGPREGTYAVLVVTFLVLPLVILVVGGREWRRAAAPSSRAQTAAAAAPPPVDGMSPDPPA